VDNPDLKARVNVDVIKNTSIIVFEEVREASMLTRPAMEVVRNQKRWS